MAAYKDRAKPGECWKTVEIHCVLQITAELNLGSPRVAVDFRTDLNHRTCQIKVGWLLGLNRI